MHNMLHGVKWQLSVPAQQHLASVVNCRHQSSTLWTAEDEHKTLTHVCQPAAMET